MAEEETRRTEPGEAPDSGSSPGGLRDAGPSRGGSALRHDPSWLAHPATSGDRLELPETRAYRLKRTLLGRPLATEDLHSERLGKPVALAVLSSDVMSSCAYASESILRILVPAVGVAAFSLITPVTGLLLLVLGLVCLCYRQVVQNYPVSGGSYVVSRENFGFTVAQIPGAALLLSYVLTVAVSVVAGVDAVISAFPVLAHYPVELSVGFVVLLTYGNLRGIREAGRIFAVPTYWFFASMGLLLGTGLVRLVLDGHLHRFPLHPHGAIPIGTSGSGVLLGTSVFLFLRGFANGGSAMTGMEAISNAVPIFREPTVRNARTTLVLMASILGVMFLSVSVFAALTHAVPFANGVPTVLSQIARSVFGSGSVGSVAYFSLQMSTAFILILGANTSFNGFPLLVNFIAADAYLPRPLRTRGHRLVYSNGVCALAVVSGALLVVTGARVASLIPLYACTVFTGFTMAGAGMTKFHWTHPSDDRRRKLFVAASTCVACFVVTLIFVVTEFTRGAWLVVVCIPLIVLLLTRTNRRYTEERRVLAEDSSSAAEDAPILRRHVVLVLVDALDLATQRAVRLARSLATSGEVRAVHFVLDQSRARSMADNWSALGRWRIPLELVECPDRRLIRAATELVAEIAADGQTEVMLVLPQRLYPGVANRLLHGNTAERLVSAVSTVTNVSATVAPFDVADHLRRRQRDARLARRRPPSPATRPGTADADHDLPGSGEPGSGEPGSGEPGSGNPGSGRHVSGDPGSGEPGSGNPVRLRPGRAGKLQAAGRASWAVRGGPSAGRIVAVDGATPIADLVYRQRGRIAGRVHSIQVQPWSGVQTLECTLVDGTGAIKVVFLGRRSVSGLEVGSRLIAEGMVGKHAGQLAIINPSYELLATTTAQSRPEVS